MTEHNSTAPAATDKPTKPSMPYPDFPLAPHVGGGPWCKKIRGRIHSWRGPSCARPVPPAWRPLLGPRAPAHIAGGGRLRDDVNVAGYPWCGPSGRRLLQLL
jgi:hypothetical protein